MGYCTAFTLMIDTGQKKISEILTEIDPDLRDRLDGIDDDGSSADSVTWYNHEQDIRELSLAYPDYVFTLYGDGDDSEDMWYKHFKNGKMQACYAKITYDDYDENKLE